MECVDTLDYKLRLINIFFCIFPVEILSSDKCRGVCQSV